MTEYRYTRKAGSAAVEPADFNDLVDAVKQLQEAAGLAPPEDGTLSGLTDVTGSPDMGTGPVYNDTGNAALVPVVTHADLDAVLDGVREVDWHVVGGQGEPQFEPDWSNVQPGWAPCRFRKLLNNSIFVEGVVAYSAPLVGEDAPVPIFYLPDDCLPGGDLAFVCESGIALNQGGPTLSRVTVFGDGTVAWGGYVTVGEGAESFLSLCGITFSVEAAA